MSSILSHFPYDRFRDVQREVLLQLEKEWDYYDVFVIVAPTATGKTSLATTIANWSGNARITTPNNMLVKQYQESFPEIPTLMGKENYPTGSKYAQAYGNFINSNVQICNNHLHATLVKRNAWTNSPATFIADEAHNLIKFQQDFNSLSYWKHKNNFPYGREDKKSLLMWLSTFKKKNEFQKALLRMLNSKNPEYIIEEDFGEWRAGGYNHEGVKIKRPKEGESGAIIPKIELTPIDVSRMYRTLWPSKTKKIVLMSATIGKKDIESLGLGRKKVRYLECKHPIPAKNRPIISDFVETINHKNFETATESICRHVSESGLLDYHAGQKGLIHATYAQSEIMRQCLGGSRFIFHNAENKREQYQKFLNSDPKEGKVLVASGMYEGLDLPEDLGRWQIVAKVPWPSLASPAISTKATQDPEWYEWKTLKDVIQACGRICRTPTDYGVSYIMDGSFDRLAKSPLAPKWFCDALHQY